MIEQSRIDELRRRIDADPSSIAFAELAEEYRRHGQHTEAIALCRTGLARHPAYLSARVTLGRALTETGDLPSARAELEQVLRVAPDSLAAIRALAEVHQRRQEPARARELMERAAALAQQGLDLEDASAAITRQLEPDEAPNRADVADATPATAPDHRDRTEPSVPHVRPPDRAMPQAPAAVVHDAPPPALAALERFLASVEVARQRHERTDVGR